MLFFVEKNHLIIRGRPFFFIKEGDKDQPKGFYGPV